MQNFFYILAPCLLFIFFVCVYFFRLLILSKLKKLICHYFLNVLYCVFVYLHEGSTKK